MLKFFCKHEWKTISELTILSQADMLHDMGKVPNTHTSFIRKYITDYTCNKCGAIKRFKESTSTR